MWPTNYWVKDFWAHRYWPALPALVVSPTAASAIGRVVDATVVLGSVTVTPSVTSAVGSVVDPAVVLGSVTVTPNVAEAVGGVVDPTVVVGGDITVTPVAAEAVGRTSVTYVGQQFEIRMEADLAEWTAAIDPHADANWSAAAGIVGTAGGMELTVDDTTAAYRYKQLAIDSTNGKARARFYINPKTMPMDNTEEIRHFVFWSATSSNLTVVALVYESGSYKIRGTIYNDAGGTSITTGITISDGPHCIEVYLQRAATSVSSDGRLDLWVDDGSQQTITGIDNYDKFATLRYAALGGYTFVGTPGSGTIYLDELLVNTDGAYIGPYGTSLSVTPGVAEAIGRAIDPTVIAGGDVTVTPVAAEAVGSVSEPGVTLGSVTVTPDVAGALGRVSDPAALLGSVTVTPAAASAIGQVSAPTVFFSSTSVTPAAAEAIGRVNDPDVSAGALLVTPGVASAVGSVVDPTAILGSVTVTPDVAGALGWVVDPSIVLGSVTVTPAAASGIGRAVDPTVIGGIFIGDAGLSDAALFGASLSDALVYALAMTDTSNP